MDPPINDLDSIDGLGMTFRDLTPSAQRLALFRSQERARRAGISETERQELADALTNAKNLSDAHQARLRSLISGG